MPILTENPESYHIPNMVKVRQIFQSQQLNDIEETVHREIYKEEILNMIKPGQKIAIAVGSRGIYQLNRIVKALIDELLLLDTKPFIIPAMGSHGGGTEEGQRDVLKSYGITEEAMGIPIISSMDVVEIGRTNNGIPVFWDKIALNADIVIPIARIKPHTDFKGKIESGLCKMMTIGLGKHKGCSRLHQEGFESFADLIPEAAKIVIDRTKVGFGIAILENAYDKTAVISAIAASNILDREPILLEQAKNLMPKIMIPEIDVLIIDELGKDISGAGIDPNIIGRTTKGLLPGYNGPIIKRIIVLDLTESTHGNACGIGLADFTVKSAVEKIDHIATYANVIASGNPEAGRIPVVMENEKEAIIAAIKCCPKIDESKPKIVKIKNTLQLGEIYISESLLSSIADNMQLEIIQ